MPKLLSSRVIVKTLEQKGFVFVSQKGSHAKYRKKAHTVIVPMGKREIPLGTLSSIIRQTGLEKTDFLDR